MNLKYSITILRIFLYWLGLAGAMVLVSGNFLIARHITLPNIGLAVMASCSVIIAIIDRKFYKGYSWGVLLSFFGIFGVFLLACLINHETATTTRHVLTLRTILIGYSAAIFILPYSDKKFYYLVFFAFILTNISIAAVTLYNYYDLIYVHHGEGLDVTWIDFIDMLSDKIIPFKIYHHTLSILTVFSIYLLSLILGCKYFIITDREKYFQIGCMFFLIGFLHFLSARIGLLIFYSGILYFGYRKMKELKIQPLKVVVPLLIMGLIVVVIFANLPTAHVKLQLTFNELNFYLNSSYREIIDGPDYRLKFYFQSFEIIKNNWVTGVGFDNFLTALAGNRHPHNTYLYYAIIFGAPLALLLFIFTYLPLFFTKRPIVMPIVVIMLIHTIYSFTDANVHIREYLYFMSFWIPMIFQYGQSLVSNPDHK